MKYESLLNEIAALLEKQASMEEKEALAVEFLPPVDAENYPIPFEEFLDSLPATIQKALKHHDINSFTNLLLNSKNDLYYRRFFNIQKVKVIQDALATIGLKMQKENAPLSAIKKRFFYLRHEEQIKFLQWCRFNINDY